jgi:hypothetical protein
MSKFKAGDKVRIKGTHIEGIVSSINQTFVYADFPFTPKGFSNIIDPDALEHIPEPLQVHNGDRITYAGGMDYISNYNFMLTSDLAHTNHIVKVERPTAFETIYEA